MAVQHGREVTIHISDDYKIGGYITEDVSLRKQGDIETIKDEENKTCTKIVYDKSRLVDLELIIEKNTNVSFEIGDTLDIGSTKYFIQDINEKQSRTARKLSIQAIKEDAMTYT